MLTENLPKNAVDRLKYQLVVKVPFEAIDNLQARQMAQELMKFCPAAEGTSVKLQMLRENKEPIGVKL